MAINLGIELEEKNETQFINKYFNFRELSTPYGVVKVDLKLKKNLEEDLNLIIGEFSYTRIKDEFNVNKKIIMVEGDKHPQIIEFENGIKNLETLNVLQKITLLQTSSNGFYYEDFLNENEEVERRTIELDSFKFEAFKRLYIEEFKKKNLESKLIVVYRFKHDLKLIEDIISKDVILLNISQSEGLNLQDRNNIIFYSTSYSFKDNAQMIGRIARIGQKQKCNIYYLIRNNSIEEKIIKILDKKESTSRILKDYLNQI
jgi:ERCC4-related helicase